VEHLPDFRRDRLHLFEVHLRTPPAIRIDNREIVEARFVPRADAPSFAMAGPFRDYMGRKAAEEQGPSRQA
jgi:hypothetical protein